MKKFLKITYLFLFLGGCSFNQYTLTYNDALKNKMGVSILESENSLELKKKVVRLIELQGYKKLVYANKSNEFYVFAKDSDFNLSCQIILKFVYKPKDTKVRIDIVNGSDDIVLFDQISRDIQTIGQEIKKS